MISNGREIIRAGYAAGTTAAEIAKQCDSTPGSVRVIAHKMGLKHRRHVSVRIPADKQVDWRNMVWRKAIAASQAATYLKLEEAGL